MTARAALLRYSLLGIAAIVALVVGLKGCTVGDGSPLASGLAGALRARGVDASLIDLQQVTASQGTAACCGLVLLGAPGMPAAATWTPAGEAELEQAYGFKLEAA